MDGKQLIRQEPRHSEEPQHSPRNLILTSMQETGFIEYMDQGSWHMAFYNDGKKMEQVFMLTTAIGKFGLFIPFLFLMAEGLRGIIENTVAWPCSSGNWKPDSIHKFQFRFGGLTPSLYYHIRGGRNWRGSIARYNSQG